jgi:(2Fe-2S) ferredoxin
MSREESFFRFHVFVCRNQRAAGAARPCCGEERGEAIRARFQQMMRRYGVEASRANKSMCLDRCELGPVVVVYPQGVWYRIEDVDHDVEEIVREHFVGGRVVERLLLPPRESEHAP